MERGRNEQGTIYKDCTRLSSALTASLTTSCVYIGSNVQTARCEKEVRLSAPLQPGSSFSAGTDDGSITIEGLETTECRVTAKVVAYAGTQEGADELRSRLT